MAVKMQETLSSIVVKKTLPYTKFLNYELNKLGGSGVLLNVLTHPRQNCPLDENPMQITFFKMIFLFTVFIFGVILSIIIFVFERAVSNKKNGTLKKFDGRQCKMVKKFPETSDIGVRCNICQSIVIGTKTIMIHPPNQSDINDENNLSRIS